MSTPTYLSVPFTDKDRAKTLGARWDAARRQWFAPAGSDLSLFAAWTDVASPNTAPAAGTTNAAPTPDGAVDNDARGLPLRDYLVRVQRIVQERLAETAWVIAEITEASLRSNGHLYLTLSQTGPDGTVVASVKAIAFSATQRTWYREFCAAVGGQPAVGMRVLAQVSARFDPRYGFSLDLAAIDPNFTLGDFAQRVAKLRGQLQAAGVYALQRELAAPTDFTAIAVIAPQGAAGLGDFERETRAAVAAGLLTQHVYHATFQGPDAEASVSAALARAIADHGTRPVDAIIVIRGGGSALDLGWLDAYAIGHAIATSPVPVWVGIGHERDRGLLDEVAQRAFDTPSKVSAQILRSIVDPARTAAADQDRLVRVVRARLAAAQEGVASRQQSVRERALHGIARRRAGVADQHHLLTVRAQQRLTAASQLLARAWEHTAQRARNRLHHGATLVRRRFDLVATSARARVQALPAKLTHHWTRTGTASQRRLERWQHALERFDLRVRAVDPARILQRGFALVRDANGRVVRDATAAAGPITLTWRDGDRDATLHPQRQDD
jgi:exodeoxyribonuclease VII large subunit